MTGSVTYREYEVLDHFFDFDPSVVRDSTGILKLDCWNLFQTNHL